MAEMVCSDILYVSVSWNFWMTSLHSHAIPLGLIVVAFRFIKLVSTTVVILCTL